VKISVVVVRCGVLAVVGGVSLVGRCKFGVVVGLVVWCGSEDAVGVARQVVGVRVAWCGVSRDEWGLSTWDEVRVARCVGVGEGVGWVDGEVVVVV